MGSLREDCAKVGITGGEVANIEARAKEYREREGFDAQEARIRAIKDALKEAQEHEKELEQPEG